MKILRAAMIGDVVGEPGLEVLELRLPAIIREHALDFVVVNGENAADGFGLTETALKRIIAAGADVVTSGNHVWEKRDFWPVLDTEERVLRPANYPSGSPGQGQARIEKNGVSWIVVNLQGRELMNPIDCPFRGFDAIMDVQLGPATHSHPLLDIQGDVNGFLPVVLVDFHAESTREKEALAYYVDGRASVVAGTHTHVQTADERVLPKGTAYITDLGMTGITGSVIGMDPGICLDRARKQVLYRMEPARKPPAGETAAVGTDGTAQGIIVEINGSNGTALSIRRI
ncbi:MAG: YmdB family metallophosphoesterase [Treponema sp.]|jgi:metallophosphoesterase (TIGR00282 family)|nr:YmdB family metallophosphoesterase [Treponema sp.]